MQVGGANSRHEGRIRALQVLYAIEVGEHPALEAFDSLFSLDFRADDIRNWQKYVKKLFQDSQLEKANPAQRIWSSFGDALKADLEASLTEESFPKELKEVLLDHFNDLLCKRTFYSSAHWDSTKIPAETKPLLEQGMQRLSEQGVKRANRALIECAHPQHILKCHYDFVRALVIETDRHREELDGLIESKSQRWDLRRIALMDHLILRAAICEFFHLPDVPPKVTINEAIEVSKAFSTDQSGGFINGILDSIYIQNEADIRRLKNNQGNTPVSNSKASEKHKGKRAGKSHESTKSNPE
ncbi:transcription antitermination factor NusB [bacterium]|nr:transcription antitermination factor NusB [bacterium]